MFAKLCIGLTLIFPSLIFASVTLQPQIGELFEVDSSAAPVGSYGIIVADKSGNGFLGDYVNGAPDFGVFAGTSLVAGALIGGAGDDEIVFSQPLSTDLGVNGLNGSVTFELDDGLDAGDSLGVYWFPEVNSTLISDSVTQYGFFRSDSVNPGSDIAFVMPGDGDVVTLSAFSDNVNSASDITTNDFTAIPEPSAYATILGLLGFGYVVFCRRRRSSSTD